MGDRRARYFFQPDRLPDSGSSRIPNRVRLQLPILLSARLGQVVRIILCPNNDRLKFFAGDRVRDIAFERRAAALMRCNDLAVYPDGGVIINGPKMEN